MIQSSYRLAKRFVILLPGILIAIFSVRTVFPYFSQKVPAAIAVLLTYILAAYVLMPAIVRVFRIIKPPKHLPLYCVTPDGFASDPLNIGIVGTRRELINAMQTAGWQMADRHSLRNIIKMMLATAYERAYPTAPVSSLYLFGRKQDLAFEIPIGNDPSHRHHVRFWATTYDQDRPLSSTSIHWHHRKAHVYGDSLLWVGAASLDVGLSLIRHNLQVSHMIDPDTDSERELIVNQLEEKGLTASLTRIKLGNPYRVINRVMRGSLHTDGKMAIVSLKRDELPATDRRSHSRSR